MSSPFAHYTLIDLTHELTPGIPVWPGSVQFEIIQKTDYDQGYKAVSYSLPASAGTHIDAPAHYIKNARDIAALTLNELIAPACVISLTKQVQENPDYALSIDDITLWEEKYGQIKPGSIVLAHTGWSKRWPDVQAYRNMDDTGLMHFPGFSPEAAEVLLQRTIVGIGIDTFSPDRAIATEFPVHHLMLKKEKYHIENLTNLDLLPPTGAVLIALPLKIKDGPEAPARVIALVPQKAKLG